MTMTRRNALLGDCNTLRR